MRISTISSHSQNERRFLELPNLLKKLAQTFFAMRRNFGLFCLFLVACAAGDFSGAKSMQHLFHLSNIGPHPTGSREQQQVRNYIVHWLQTQNWQIQLVPFVYKGVQGYNILAYKGNGSGILLGTHYDTRPISDRNPPELQHLPVPGANDGNSGTALLLEMARILREPKDFRIWLAFFDAEDMGNIDGWPFSVGASFASQMELNLTAVIIADMIGDRDLKIYQEANSDRTLTESIWGIARSLGFSEYFIPQVKYRIIDDHLPFALRGIPSALVIDFDYPYWHTSEDTPDKVSPESLEIVGKVLKTWVEKEGPKWVRRK